MAAPFEKEVAYFCAADFLQGPGKECPGKYSSHDPSFFPKSGITSVKSYPGFWLMSRKACRKGLSMFISLSWLPSFLKALPVERGAGIMFALEAFLQHWLCSETNSVSLCNPLAFLCSPAPAIKVIFKSEQCHVKAEHTTPFVSSPVGSWTGSFIFHVMSTENAFNNNIHEN